MGGGLVDLGNNFSVAMFAPFSTPDSVSTSHYSVVVHNIERSDDLQG